MPSHHPSRATTTTLDGSFGRTAIRDCQGSEHPGLEGGSASALRLDLDDVGGAERQIDFAANAHDLVPLHHEHVPNA